MWRVPELLAAADDTDCATATDAAQFCAALAERLQVDPSLIYPAYEDIHYHLWREHRLPANVLAEDAKLRIRWSVRGWRACSATVSALLSVRVLPLRRAVHDDVRIWQSGKWFFRGDALFLLPGDSPIGYRLPLDSLPWADPEAIEHEIEPDPFAPHAAVAAAPERSAPPLPPSDYHGRRRGRLPPGCAGCAGGRPRRTRPGAHRAVRRAARRHDPRILPAALSPPRTGWRWSPRSRTSPANSAARWCWKAICRRAIRACCISR